MVLVHSDGALRELAPPGYVHRVDPWLVLVQLAFEQDLVSGVAKLLQRHAETGEPQIRLQQAHVDMNGLVQVRGHLAAANVDVQSRVDFDVLVLRSAE